MTKRIYSILVKDGWTSKLVQELNAWGVSSNKYQVEGNTIITSDTNVVDVATETFINNLHLISISSAKVKS